MDKFLSSFEPAGLVRRSGAFVSSNYDRASRKLEIDLSTAIGGVDVEWVEDK
jgi:predicted membrane protein